MAPIRPTNRPSIFVISGPSGAGKGTALAIIAEHFPEIVRTPTFTTRQRRPSEVDGQDYLFVSEETFAEKVRSGEIYEFTLPYRDYQYGSPRELIAPSDDIHRVVELDFRGMLRTRALSTARVVSIFILPPPDDVLLSRISDRHPELNIPGRLRSNAEQLEVAWAYDYAVENNDRGQFEHDIVTVVSCELLRAKGIQLLAERDPHMADPREHAR